jgi:hypothetical protein
MKGCFQEVVAEIAVFILGLAPGNQSECERIFSMIKRFIPSDRNRLKDDIIEAMSSLKH